MAGLGGYGLFESRAMHTGNATAQRVGICPRTISSVRGEAKGKLGGVLPGFHRYYRRNLSSGILKGRFFWFISLKEKTQLSSEPWF